MSILINGVKLEKDMVMSYVDNPKRSGFKAHARYELYKNAASIEEYMEICEGDIKYAKPDLRYDEEHGYLLIHDAEGNPINNAAINAELE